MSASGLYDLDQAIAIQLNHLDQQQRDREHKQMLENAERQRRCTEIARELHCHLMRHEAVIVPMAMWTVEEDGYHPNDRTYTAYIDFGDPQAAENEDYDNLRRVQTTRINLEQIQSDRMARCWFATYNRRGGEFKNFVEAATFAKTGRQ